MFARIGDILVRAGVVKAEDIDEAMEISSELGVSIGKTLVMSAYISDLTLQAVVQLQSLMKDGLVSPDQTLKAIKLVHDRSLTLVDALREVGWQPRNEVGGNKLGSYLVESGLLDESSLSQALETARETNLSLGRVLILNRKISHSLLWSVLNAQVLVRDGRISKEQAILAIQETSRRQASIDNVLTEKGIETKPATRKMRLGEILVLSGLISEEHLMNALEIGLITNKPVGEVLIERGILGAMVIERALQLQQFVDDGSVQPIHAPEVLRFVIQQKCTVSKAVLEMGLMKPIATPKLKLGELLKLAGLLTEEEIEDAVRLSAKNSALLGQMLVMTGIMDDGMIQSALECQNMIRDGKIREEQAIIALNFCQRMRCGFKQAIHDLGWADEVEEKGRSTQSKMRRISEAIPVIKS